MKYCVYSIGYDQLLTTPTPLPSPLPHYMAYGRKKIVNIYTLLGVKLGQTKKDDLAFRSSLFPNLSMQPGLPNL